MSAVQNLRTIVAYAGLIAVAMAAGSAAPVQAAADVKCSMTFTMSGWSAFYKTASGSGAIKCSNGEAMTVKLSAKGGGLTVGKSTIEDGKGEFSGVKSIGEVLGSYVAAEAHAGAVKSAKAQVMTKGEVSLALSGTGRGWDLGIAFGKLTISQ
jgi:peroxiredoxin family protein